MNINKEQQTFDMTAQPDFRCPACNDVNFESVLRLKYIPPFLVGNAKPLLQPYTLTRCKICLHVFTDEEITNFKP